MCKTEKLEKPAVKNIPSSFKRHWALQVPSLQKNKVHWDNWGDQAFFVRNPSHYVLMKCGTRQFWRFENEFHPF